MMDPLTSLLQQYVEQPQRRQEELAQLLEESIRQRTQLHHEAIASISTEQKRLEDLLGSQLDWNVKQQALSLELAELQEHTSAFQDFLRLYKELLYARHKRDQEQSKNLLLQSNQ